MVKRRRKTSKPRKLKRADDAVLRRAVFGPHPHDICGHTLAALNSGTWRILMDVSEGDGC